MDLVDTLLNQYEGFVKTKARHLARDKSEADELAQKANIVLWQQCDQLSEMSEISIKSFLSKTLRNALIDIRRRERLIVSYDTLSHAGGRFEEAVLDKLAVMSVIHQLSDQEQDIIFKVYFLGMDSSAIGNALNLPPSTVRSKRMRAQRKLKNLLQRKGQDL